MLEWQALPHNFAFYTTGQHDVVGYWWVDKTKTKPTRWRLRLTVDNKVGCTIIRIAKPEEPQYPLDWAAGAYSYSTVAQYMPDLRKAAEAFRLKPIGQQRLITVTEVEIMKTDLLGMPHA